jgi:diguanylate cyclase (GGDEF)-like protein/PAS domain S-box-containing protein
VFRAIADAALLFTGAFSGIWFLLLDPIVDRHELHSTTLALTAAYPTLDLVLLALTLRFTFTSGRWPLSYRLVATAFFAMFLGDITWRIGVANGSYAVSSWINTLFMGAYALWAVAALHPSIEQIGRFSRVGALMVLRGPWRRLGVLALATSMPPVVLVLGHDRIHTTTDLVAFGVIVSLLPLLSLLRLGDMLRTVQRVATERDLIIDASPVPICVLDRDGIVRVWNPAAEAIAGYAAADVIGMPSPLVPAEDEERVLRLYSETLRGVVHERVDMKVLTVDRRPIDVRVSTAPLQTDDGRVVALFEDVTHEREQAAAIEFLATHDPLTDLPNRRRFERELATVTARVESVPAHVVLFDIDDFKSLNDTGGHSLGDDVLRELAALLRASIRRDGSLARLSGDEFALILDDTDNMSALRVVERLLDSARDFRLEAGGVTYDVTLSAGLYSIAPGDSPALALRRADEALYHAKAAGKNRSQSWTPSPVAFIGASRAWSPRIKDALRDDRLDLYLQPIVDLADEAPAYYEALCRLRAKDGSIVPAGDWIEHAEQVGLMPAVDLRMIEKAEGVICSDHPVKVFVNISASSVHDDAVLHRLETALQRVPAGSLGIEITEHTALSDPTAAAVTLSRMRELGALVAIDDFGVGFTSFTELATLPCDIVKIPGTFTSGSESNPDTAVIAGAITNVAHHYGKRVVIEGVECPAMARRAKLIGIEYAQGWHFGRPMPSAERVTAALPA